MAQSSGGERDSNPESPVRVWERSVGMRDAGLLEIAPSSAELEGAGVYFVRATVGVQVLLARTVVMR